MKLVFSDDKIPNKIEKSIFLAGPSPRMKGEDNWRKRALYLLKELDYKGTVFIPLTKAIYYEDESLTKNWDYINQISWECEARKIADCVVYWIPRTKEMIGLTTNLEFGEDLKLKKIFYGRPEYAIKCRYLDRRMQMLNKPIYTGLKTLLNEAINYLDCGAERKDGEINVPLQIWNTLSFQNWLKKQNELENKLIDFELGQVIYSKSGDIFYFSAKVNVYVKKEDRYKSNESIFSRIDVSSVVPYYVEPDGETYIILAKEFRSPVINKTGFAWDLPSGSSFNKKLDNKEIAKAELHEELGLDVENDRLIFVSENQINASFTTHKNFIYKVKLTKKEFDNFNKNEGKISSLDGGKSGEINYIKIIKLNEIKKFPLDTNTIGAIFLALM